MTKLWKRLDVSQENIYHIGDDDEIYYAREYISGRNYQASVANHLISNFKKPVSRRGRPEWRHKIKAIRQFAEELSLLLDPKGIYFLTSIPSSKCKTDPEYDPRVEDTLSELGTIRTIVIEEPIATRETIVPAHLGGTRDRDTLYNNMQWVGFENTIDQIVLVDDVITTGSHFAACKKIILEHEEDVKIIGIFWAKTIWDDNNP
jgi:hypothetical protein